MRNVVPTEIITLRLPSDLVECIDEWIMRSKYYSNRPDFIISAVRSYMRPLEDWYVVMEEGPEPYSKSHSKEDEDEIKKNFESFISIVEKDKEAYSKIGGKPVTILLRVPVGVGKKWDSLKDILPIKNYQDFIRYSIVPFARANGYYDPMTELKMIEWIRENFETK